MAYIAASDIKDELIKAIVAADTTYLDRADDALEDLAASVDVEVADIETAPLHFRVKEFLKAYVGWEVCFNNRGLTNKKIIQEDIVFDPYEEKFKTYEKQLRDTQEKITYEVLRGEADEPSEFSSEQIRIFRG